MIPYETKPDSILDIFSIAIRMRAAGLSSSFVTQAAMMALEFEGTFDLLVLWDREKDESERDKLIADIQDEIDGWSEAPSAPIAATKINFDELDAHIDQIVEFKRKLRALVDAWGGIKKLADVTGIPQPSVSRFFNSVSLPRRTTLHKITAALVPSTAADDWELPDTIEKIAAAMKAARSQDACDV